MKIAFSGKLRSGKTSAAKHLVFNHPKFFLLSLAEPLKASYEALGLPEGPKPRKFLQKQGDLVKECFGDDVFIKLLLNRVAIVEDHSNNPVVDDMRFPNEYTSLRERGFIVIRIECEDAQRINRIDNYKPEHAKHASETALDKFQFDYTIENNGTLKEFLQKVDDVMEKIYNGS